MKKERFDGHRYQNGKKTRNNNFFKKSKEAKSDGKMRELNRHQEDAKNATLLVHLKGIIWMEEMLNKNNGPNLD